MLCLRKFAVAIKIMDKRTGGIKIFRKNIFLSQSTGTFRRGKFLCCVSESFRLQKTLWITKGGIKIFRRKVFV